MYVVFVYIRSIICTLFTCLGLINIQVHKAVDACKNVLRGLHGNKISQRELDRVSSFLIFYPFLFSSLKWISLDHVSCLLTYVEIKGKTDPSDAT